MTDLDKTTANETTEQTAAKPKPQRAVQGEKLRGAEKVAPHSDKSNSYRNHATQARLDTCAHSCFTTNQ